MLPQSRCQSQVAQQEKQTSSEQPERGLTKADDGFPGIGLSTGPASRGPENSNQQETRPADQANLIEVPMPLHSGRHCPLAAKSLAHQRASDAPADNKDHNDERDKRSGSRDGAQRNDSQTTDKHYPMKRVNTPPARGTVTLKKSHVENSSQALRSQSANQPPSGPQTVLRETPDLTPSPAAARALPRESSSKAEIRFPKPHAMNYPKRLVKAVMLRSLLPEEAKGAALEDRETAKIQTKPLMEPLQKSQR